MNPRNQPGSTNLLRLAPVVAFALFLVGATAQDASASCGGLSPVTSEFQLEVAILTFNAVTTGPCVFSVVLLNDIKLTASLPAIDNGQPGVSFVINGDDRRVFGSGSAGIRPFAIAVGTTVTMNDLTVAEGRLIGGGAAARGAGISNRGTLTLNRVTLDHNVTEGSGGGLYNDNGSVEINDSTISNNASTGAGQGGGGIFTVFGLVTLRNTTISRNDAEGLHGVGGGIRADGDVIFDSVTVTDNFAHSLEGSGVWFKSVSPTTLTTRNSIIGENVATDCFFDEAASVVDQGHNLTTDNDCGLPDGVNGNIVGFADLFPLADNGGPTLTHLPKLTSKAIDNGDTTLTTDQRGEPRPAGSSDDIGAVESLPCDDTTFTVNNANELNEAILCFNEQTAPGVYTIEVVKATPLSVSPPTVDNATAGVSLVINGNGHGLGGSGLPGVRALDVAADTTVTVNDARLEGGDLTGANTGAGLRNAGTVTLNRVDVNFGTAESGTGGIANLAGAILVINQGSVRDNTSTTGAGAGIDNAAGASLTITNTTISNNTTAGNGGGLASAGSLTLDSVTVTGNSAALGSGVYLGGTGPFTIGNSLFADSLGAGADCHLASGSITDVGHNLVETQNGCGFVNGVNDDIVGVDPMLGQRRKNTNGTFAYGLLNGSPGLDTGATSLTLDQRGNPRPSGSADDIGAVEDLDVGDITIVKVTTPSDASRMFDFILTGGTLPLPLPFLLDGGVDIDSVATSETITLPEGSYRIFEIVNDEWGPESISCADDPAATVDLADASVTFDIVRGSEITCTFSNVVTEADLSVSLTDSPDPVVAGTQLTYVATVSNAGPSVSRQVTLVFPRPLGTTVVSATPDGDGDCTITPSEVACTWLSAPVSATARTATIVVDVNPDVAGGTVINATATVSSNVTPDPNDTNDSTTADTTVQAQASLSATKVGSFDPSTRVLTYGIDLLNSGPSNQPDNPGPELVDVLPLGFDYLGSSATSGTLTFDAPSRTLEWSGAVQVGQVVSITVEGIVDLDVAGSSISNQAEVRFDGDGDGTNESTAPSDDPGPPGATDPTVVSLDAVADIPTLGEWGLISLVLLLGVLGVATMRRGS